MGESESGDVMFDSHTKVDELEMTKNFFKTHTS